MTELEAAAERHKDKPLVILGHVVDKTNTWEVYGALCWIEEQLQALLERR